MDMDPGPRFQHLRGPGNSATRRKLQRDAGTDGPARVRRTLARLSRNTT